MPSGHEISMYFQLVVDIGGRRITSEVIFLEKVNSEVLDISLYEVVQYSENNGLYFGTLEGEILYYDNEGKEWKSRKHMNFDSEHF
jgi:hypothetical protein